ncbi:MAG: electron transport complex subunit RsxC [Gammaproteobacteria bacterium]|nr:electron transport complex subunit RsxC [Gammaproteobacteria bacterium]
MSVATAARYDFPGGVVLPPVRGAAAEAAIVAAGLPARLVLPLQQHIGTPSVAIVTAGERVLKGQLIARSGSEVGMHVHASTSGTVAGVGAHPIAHPGAVSVPAIILDADGEDRRAEPLAPIDWVAVTPQEVQLRIAAAGVVGLGGAGFPTHMKVREGIGAAVHTLIINGVECEPGVSADERLLRERTREVLAGARILAHAVQARRCILAVKRNPAVEAALAATADAAVAVVAVPASYPAGGEKQLILALTGIEVPSAGLPIHAGILMYNVATAAAVQRAVVHGEPLISRVVTVAGAVRRPGNFDVAIGTPVAHLLDAAGGLTDPGAVIVAGGPMMGVRVHDVRVPVTKPVNAVLALADAAMPVPALPCIRCGRCVNVCPVRLQPQALYAQARAGNLDAAQDLHLFDCIECGCCAYVCPSGIPLVHYYRYAKGEIDALDRAAARAQDARQRFEIRAARALGDDDGPVDDNGSGASSDDRRAYVAAAIERVRSRRAAAGPEPAGGDDGGT